MEKPTKRTFNLNSDQWELIKSCEYFTLNSDKKMTLAEHSNEIIILNFILGSWCPMCMKHVLELNTFFGDLGDKDYKLVFVTTEKEKSLKDSMDRVSKANKINLNSVLIVPDASKGLLNIFGLKVPLFGFAKPATIVLNPSGEAVVISTGIPNNEYIKCDISNFLSQRASA